MGNREAKTRSCQKFEEKFILLIWATKITRSSRMQGESWRHQRSRVHHVKESHPKASIRKTVISKMGKFKESEAKTSRFRCIADVDESIGRRIDFSTNRTHKGHNAGKEKNSVVYYTLSAKQVKPREGPNVTLRKSWDRRSSNTLRLPRETEVTLQK